MSAGCDQERVVVTGATGFVGPYLIQQLKSRGFHITAIAASIPSNPDPKIQYCELDIRDAESLRRLIQDCSPTRIYHLAAISEVGLSWSNPRLTFEVNVLGTYNVFDAAMQLKSPPKVLNISTSQVYASSAIRLNETCLVKPDSPYSASKAVAELLTVQYGRIPIGGITTARSFNHCGPGQTPNFFLSSVAKQFAEMEAGSCPRTLTLGNLTVKRDLTDVRDVVRAYDLLIENGQPWETYNVCSGVSVSLAEVVHLFQDLVDFEVAIRADPTKVRPNDSEQVCGDPTKIRHHTGWTPLISLETTVRDTLDYWRSKCRESMSPAL